MDRREARHLIDAYIASWKDREIDRFLETLSDDAVVIEWDGSNARGLEASRRRRRGSSRGMPSRSAAE